MNKKIVDPDEMELRQDKDVVNAKKMVAEGGPVAQDDQAEADAESERAKALIKKKNNK
ncbi:hypothetical protein [Sporosarcina sp. G11-34]|uniref:hypothetical protein n=1 Tax=Sporosarcina sp. G11-34 TaxID=2849605 RepID=UPI0022A8E538|nr:hypothetical protein [Sporosarcina sp. G11-34]MCZ2256885.1 hypothetical protein [Sporosarcina sp. G11-34]